MEPRLERSTDRAPGTALLLGGKLDENTAHSLPKSIARLHMLSLAVASQFAEGAPRCDADNRMSLAEL